MPSVNFSGVTVNTFSGANQNGSVKRLIHVKTNPPTKAVREAMDWDEIPDCAEDMGLTGELIGTNLVLVPSDDKLEKHELEMECTSAAQFVLNRIQDKDGGGKKIQLSFVIESREKGALAKLENYCEKVGKGAATLKIGYQDQADLPLEKGSEVVGEKKATAGA